MIYIASFSWEEKTTSTTKMFRIYTHTHTHIRVTYISRGQWVGGPDQTPNGRGSVFAGKIILDPKPRDRARERLRIYWKRDTPTLRECCAVILSLSLKFIKIKAKVLHRNQRYSPACGVWQESIGPTKISQDVVMDQKYSEISLRVNLPATNSLSGYRTIYLKLAP